MGLSFPDKCMLPLVTCSRVCPHFIFLLLIFNYLVAKNYFDLNFFSPHVSLRKSIKCLTVTRTINLLCFIVDFFLYLLFWSSSIFSFRPVWLTHSLSIRILYFGSPLRLPNKLSWPVQLCVCLLPDPPLVQPADRLEWISLCRQENPLAIIAFNCWCLTLESANSLYFFFPEIFYFYWNFCLKWRSELLSD